MDKETKTCPYCEKEIGKSEEICPNCKFDFTQFDDETISNFERISTIVQRRKQRAEEAEKAERKRKAAEAEKNAPKPKRFFDSLKGKK